MILPNFNQKPYTIAPTEQDLENVFASMSFIAKTQNKHNVGHQKANLISQHLTLAKEMIKQYNQELIIHGYGISRSALKHKDFVDLRPVFHLTKDTQRIPNTDLQERTKEYETWCQCNDFITDVFYTSIPCFIEGVYQVNKNRYIYWNIKDINIDELEMTVYLMDYMACDGYWQPGVSGTTTITFDSNTQLMSIVVETDEIYLFSKIYTLLSYDQLHWSKEQQDLWENVIIKHAKLTEDELDSKDTNNVMELCKIFLHCTNLLNFFLATEKPKTQRKKSTKSTQREIDTTYVNTPRKLVRTIGKITVKSEKTPKQSTERTVIKYKVASWKRRGFIRHYKSGKTVYIKETTYHRHCLNDETKPPQSVIKLRL